MQPGVTEVLICPPQLFQRVGNSKHLLQKHSHNLRTAKDASADTIKVLQSVALKRLVCQLTQARKTHTLCQPAADSSAVKEESLKPPKVTPAM